MKFCNKCQTSKPEEDFHLSKTKGLQAYCKVCRKGVDKAYWRLRSKNPEKMALKTAYNKEKNEERQQFIFEFLQSHPCVDCGITDPMVLTFDHVRGKKKFAISNALKNGVAMESIVEEIAKCEVRCANCHMRKTAKDFGWYTYKMTNRV
jgi:5-methylcytosine-specific restriction endonuclease McrA